MQYLDMASRLYRYPFPDTLLIHTQCLDATACAEQEMWTGKMRRWVNRGAAGSSVCQGGRYSVGCDRSGMLLKWQIIYNPIC